MRLSQGRQKPLYVYGNPKPQNAVVVQRHVLSAHQPRPGHHHDPWRLVCPRSPDLLPARTILLCGAEVANIASREYDLFDFLLERLIAPPVAGDRCIGQGLSYQSRSPSGANRSQVVTALVLAPFFKVRGLETPPLPMRSGPWGIRPGHPLAGSP